MNGRKDRVGRVMSKDLDVEERGSERNEGPMLLALRAFEGGSRAANGSRNPEPSAVAGTLCAQERVRSGSRHRIECGAWSCPMLVSLADCSMPPPDRAQALVAHSGCTISECRLGWI